jgi:hypothetical protein
VRRFLSGLVLCLSLAGTGVAQDETLPKPDAFFAGTVIESTPEKLTVSRMVRGKTEKRSFAVTPDTKVEGKLRLKVRVTVRYTTDDDGDTATRILVRAGQRPKLR